MARRVRTKSPAAGEIVPSRTLDTIAGDSVSVPDPERLVHLQLRRFAGCLICDLHLRSVAQRHDEIEGAGVREVVVFHSPADDFRGIEADLPFDVVADPGRRLYAEFGVERSARALLDLCIWPAIARAVARGVRAIARKERPPPPMRPHGGLFGRPGDFLIASDGRVLASKHGRHAYDQWSVDELLSKVREVQGTIGASLSLTARRAV